MTKKMWRFFNSEFSLTKYRRGTDTIRPTILSDSKNRKFGRKATPRHARVSIQVESRNINRNIRTYKIRLETSAQDFDL